MVHENMVDEVQSDGVLHQSGSGKEYEDDEKEYEGEVEKKVEGNVEAEVNITHCGIHAKIDTWVIHHP